MTQDISRKHTSSGWHIALEKASKDNYLGDPVLVERMLRNFVGRIFFRYEQCVSGVITQEEAKSGDKADCQHLGEIFAGESSDYSSVGDWNGEGLVRYLRELIGEEHCPGTTNVEVITQVMALLALEVYGLINGLNHGEDEVETRELVEQKISDWKHALLGLPPPGEDE
jgi:hypothetical protein